MPDLANESKRTVADHVREHSGLALTAIYILLIGIGMMYEWWLFRRFNINILYFAEAADFLLVPFREPLVVFISFLPVPLFAIYMGSVQWFARKIAKKDAKPMDQRTAAFYRKFMSFIRILAPLLWSIAFTAEFAQRVARDIRDGKRQRVVVETTAANGVTPVSVTGTIIGSTSQYIFLHDPKTDQTRIIATENIAEIVVDPKKKKKKPGATA